MSNIKIDDKDYDFDSLSNEAKSQLQMINICDQELSRLNAQLAITQTARLAYSKALLAELPVIGSSDIINLS